MWGSGEVQDMFEHPCDRLATETVPASWKKPREGSVVEGMNSQRPRLYFWCRSMIVFCRHKLLQPTFNMGSTSLAHHSAKVMEEKRY